MSISETMKPLCLVKIGGRPAADNDVSLALITEMKALSSDYQFILVHGGGHAVSELSSKLGITPQFKDGIRMTSAEEMEIVDQVLAGSMNTRLLRDAFKAELPAIGLCGADSGLIVGSHLSQNTLTAKVKRVNNELIRKVLAANLTPIISSVSVTEDGSAANINADDAALALAESLQSDLLVFISDIPGVLRENELVSELNAERIIDLIQAKVIQGGMIPKVQNALEAVRQGVSQVVIGNWSQMGDLKGLLLGKRGTRIQ